MRRSDRLARLHELLARVQRNAAERRGEVATIAFDRGSTGSEAPGAEVEPRSEPPRQPVLRAHLEPIPPPPASPSDLSDRDDWSSLLTRELSDPNPLAEAAEETTFPSLIPLEPLPMLGAAAAMSAPPTVRPPDSEPAPESQFEHAVRIATEQRPEPPDPRALWLEAAGELRERRITLPPEDDPLPAPEPAALPTATATATPIANARRSVRPVAAEPHADTPTPIATFETTHANPRAFDSIAPAPMGRRRRTLRPSPTPLVMGEPPADRPTPYWAVILLGSVVGVLFTLAYVAFRALDKPGGAAAQAALNTTLVTGSVETATTHEPAPAATPPTSVEVHTSARASSSAPPLPVIRRPKDMGLLWVDAPSPVTIYVQGLPAGENGTYLEVPCGLKNVRLARRDLPPPGHSFPMWLGKAESVMVPCGAANRVKMSSE